METNNKIDAKSARLNVWNVLCNKHRERVEAILSRIETASMEGISSIEENIPVECLQFVESEMTSRGFLMHGVSCNFKPVDNHSLVCISWHTSGINNTFGINMV